MIVGSVSSEVYRRIEDYVRRTSGADASPTPANATAAETKLASEQPKNISPTTAESSAPSVTATASPDSKPPSEANPVAAATSKPENTIAASPNPWETLRVGARVLAAYWNEKREFEGFWVATVKRIDKGEFTLEWFEAPEYPTFKSRPKNIAVPHPEFRVSGK